MKVLDPLLRILSGIAEDNIPDPSMRNLYENELPMLLRCIEEYHTEMVILIDRSAGSGVDDYKEKLAGDISSHLRSVPVLEEDGFR